MRHLLLLPAVIVLALGQCGNSAKPVTKIAQPWGKSDTARKIREKARVDFLASYGLAPQETRRKHGPGWEERYRAWCALPDDRTGPRPWRLGAGERPYFHKMYVWNIRTRQYELHSGSLTDLGGKAGDLLVTTRDPFLGFDYDPQGGFIKLDLDAKLRTGVLREYSPFNKWHKMNRQLVAWYEINGPNWERDRWPDLGLGTGSKLLAEYKELPTYLCRPWRALWMYRYWNKTTVRFTKGDGGAGIFVLNAHENRITRSWVTPWRIRKVQLVEVQATYLKSGREITYKHHEYRIYYHNNSTCTALQHYQGNTWDFVTYELDPGILNSRKNGSRNFIRPDSNLRLVITKPLSWFRPVIYGEDALVLN